jgi:hypothetical protein
MAQCNGYAASSIPRSTDHDPFLSLLCRRLQVPHPVVLPTAGKAKLGVVGAGEATDEFAALNVELASACAAHDVVDERRLRLTGEKGGLCVDETKR